jgi:sulfhydrogenase subunit beta (sulfur reductase)
MTLQMLSKESLAQWVDALGQRYRIFAPKRRYDTPLPGDADPPRAGGQIVFAEIRRARELELDYGSTTLPPKKYLLPQREPLFHFEDNGRLLEPQLDDRPAVILGVHTCDLHAILMLDQVFGKEPADQHYLARRASTTIVSVECLEACSPNAFCKDMGTWITPEEFDLHLTDLGDVYAVETGSARGTDLLRDAAAVRPATEADYRRLNRAMSAKWSRFPYRLEVDSSGLPSLMAISYRSQLWEDIGQKCLGCGSCTMVCPTCQCFDVTDEVNFDMTSGWRARVWDSCQFAHFATVAGGHDFRASRAARLRHRFLHKFKYQAQGSNHSGCVGCGRCADACLVNITPVQVINELQRKQVAQAGRQREVVL